MKKYYLKFKMICQNCDRVNIWTLELDTLSEYYEKKAGFERDKRKLVSNICPYCEPTNPDNKLN